MSSILYGFSPHNLPPITLHYSLYRAFIVCYSDSPPAFLKPDNLLRNSQNTYVSTRFRHLRIHRMSLSRLSIISRFPFSVKGLCPFFNNFFIFVNFVYFLEFYACLIYKLHNYNKKAVKNTFRDVEDAVPYNSFCMIIKFHTNRYVILFNSLLHYISIFLCQI